ncbi:uncharacterized protein [Clytia hemisphaerica]|uniref:uncharacterized protein n=1 Tax=Clytia hemisphaerica TaxID=252671 RepID=UPI0034D58BBD|eukprot:TCONS_00007318-protein
MDTMTLANIELQKSKQNIARLSKEIEILKNKCKFASNDCLVKESKIRKYKKENVDLRVKLAKEKAINASLRITPKPFVKSPSPVVKSNGADGTFKSRDWRVNDPSQKITVIREVCGPNQNRLSTPLGPQQPKSKPQIPKPVQMKGYLFVPAEYVKYMPGFGSSAPIQEVQKVKGSQDFRLNSSQSQEKINKVVISPTKKDAHVDTSYEDQLIDTPALPIPVTKSKIDSVNWADFEYDDDQKVDYNEILQF